MSLSYNGTTSILTADATQTLGTLITAAGWFKATNEGESNAGSIYQHGPAGTQRSILNWNVTTGHKLRFEAGWSSVNGDWEMTTGFGALGIWQWACVTYDHGSTANHPILYVFDGTTFSVLTNGSGLTRTSTPSGSADADNQLLYVGNASSTGTTFNGLIGEFALWKRILTAEEVAAVFVVGVDAVPDHFNYLHQADGSVQNLGSSGTTFTASNTSVGENPPIRPAGRRG